MTNKSLYPIKFQPILKEKIWGGNKLKTKLNKQTSKNNIGESWEISDVENNTSIVINGYLKDKSLKELIKTYKADFLGEKNYKLFGEKFPLLIKFIDAKQDLSVQLHPNNELAAKRHNSFGKTEMWYVMQADKDAKLIVGFNKEVNKQEYINAVTNKTITKLLNFETVKKGDTYFIEVGRIHAIGAGIMLAEIQQTSDITYRIYDWDRLDNQGKARELHNDLAIEAINFNMKNDFKINYSEVKNKNTPLVKCPYFTTNHLLLDQQKIVKENTFNSFIIYICVEGSATITANNITENIVAGETILLPAILKTFQITAKKAKLLEVYV